MTIWFLLAACSGGGDDAPAVTDGDDDDDSVGTESDSGTVEVPRGPFENLYVAAQFGYDDATGGTATVDLSGTSIPPTLEIYVATDAWDNDLEDTANYCYIVLPLDHAPPSAAAEADPRLYWGAQYDVASDPPESNCHTPGWELDPYVWGDDVVQDFVINFADSWFAAVGDPSDTVADTVIPKLGADGIYVVGGALGVPSFLGFVVQDVYGFAWSTDAGMVVQVDGSGAPVPLEASVVDATLPTAWYDLSSYTSWSLAR